MGFTPLVTPFEEPPLIMDARGKADCAPITGT
jgi:hypothetical protein